MEIKDNQFSRQFETQYQDKLLSLEYSFQEKKIFLTKINYPEGFEDDDFVDHFLIQIMEIIEEKNLRVMPIYPRVSKFFKKFPKYKVLLPPGIKI